MVNGICELTPRREEDLEEVVLTKPCADQIPCKACEVLSGGFEAVGRPPGVLLHWLEFWTEVSGIR